MLCAEEAAWDQPVWPPRLSAIGDVTRHQQGVDQPPASLGLYFGDNRDMGKCGPDPHLHLEEEVKSLANNEVQKCCDE